VDGLQTEIPWKGVPERVTVPCIGLQRVNPSLVLFTPFSLSKGGREWGAVRILFSLRVGLLGNAAQSGW